MRYSDVSPFKELERTERMKKIQISIDNNLWNTSIIRKVGFPAVNRTCDAELKEDWILKDWILKSGYKWINVHEIESMHQKKNLANELSKAWRSVLGIENNEYRKGHFKLDILRFIYSPVRATQMTAKGETPPSFLWVYPWVGFLMLIRTMIGLNKNMNPTNERRLKE
jgi:hypothetical protein